MWEQRPANTWTSGFFAGTLWYVFELTRDDKWKRLAERWTTGLESDKSLRTTHDLGFMMFDSFGHAYLLTGESRDSEIVIDAARSLATRYNARVGAIKSWDTDSLTDARRAWQYPVIIDNIMNLPLLFWAASHGGDPAWRQMATSHAMRTARVHLRSDGSTAHVALFDPSTGNLERTVTWQGYSDSSAWARGQAWAIHGFAAAYAFTRRPELLRAAQRSADFFLKNLPSDGVPPWDFRAPHPGRVPRDASAAAIAASGLLDLARWSPKPLRSRYVNAADHIIASLEKNYLSTAVSGDAILSHSIGGLPQKSEVDVGLIYADYYFMEALVRRRGVFLE
jgi:unsaturated chondroitin disaccharide hydrolase